MDSAGTWFFNTPDKAAAYQLAKQGYDVYLGNNRGNIYSYKHVNLTVEDNAYWDHTFHEMAVYDAPAFQREILKQTGKDQLIYVGHSQGTLQFWIANIMLPYEQFGKNVKAMVAVAPVMYLNYANSILMKETIALCMDLILPMFANSLLWLKDGYSFIDTAFVKIAPYFMEYFPRTGRTLVEGFTGFTRTPHIALTQMPMLASNDVGGSGTRNLKHYF